MFLFFFLLGHLPSTRTAWRSDFRTVTISDAKLAQSLTAGFWSPDLCPKKAISRPQRSASRVRLAPLGTGAPPTPSSRGDVDEYLPSPVARAPSVGHVGTLWGMRHSAPSAACAFRRHSAPSSLLAPQSGRMAELASSCSDVTQSCSLASRRPHKEVRSRRIRRPADFGSSLGGCSRLRTSHSCAGLQTADSRSSASSCEQQPAAVKRSSSTPPTGTSKADVAAGAEAKARAVAALQRLFFEEMAKNGQDASGAAARALLRLSEAPSEPAMPSCHSAAGYAAAPSAAALAACPPSDDEAPDAEEEAPARQPSKEHRNIWACPDAVPRIMVGA